MITTINEFKKHLVESINNIKFVEETLNYQHYQYDLHMDMYVDNIIVAYADYSLYNHKIQIKMIESLTKNNGYGVELMKELASRYGYENLERTQLTPDGVKMRKKLDDYFNFDYKQYKESQNKHISINTIKQIKYPLIVNFLCDIVLYGRSNTWTKYLDKIRDFENTESFKKLGLDFNDISDISEWIKGSVENHNLSDYDVPDHITNDLNKLL